MTGTSIPTPTRKYDLCFARWVYKNVEGADRLSLCMQCGMCSGSCPIGGEMDNGPRKLFMMIRAGMKEEVLTASTIWNCTQCYNCVVRCPRQVPVTYILQSLAAHAHREGYAPKKATARFSKAFWLSVALVRPYRRAHGDDALLLLLRHQGRHQARAREPAHRAENGDDGAHGASACRIAPRVRAACGQFWPKPPRLKRAKGRANERQDQVHLLSWLQLAGRWHPSRPLAQGHHAQARLSSLRPSRTGTAAARRSAM